VIENRKSPRRDGGNRAAVIYAGGRPPIMCSVADISDGGAGLTVVTINGIPDEFDLHIKGEDNRRRCKVAWKQPNRLGVSF
jgi:hypothetical protein